MFTFRRIQDDKNSFECPLSSQAGNRLVTYHGSDRRALLKTQLLSLPSPFRPVHAFAAPHSFYCRVTKSSSHPPPRPIHRKPAPAATLLYTASILHFHTRPRYQSFSSISFTESHPNTRIKRPRSSYEIGKSYITIRNHCGAETHPGHPLIENRTAPQKEPKEPWIRLQLAADSNSKEPSSPYMMSIKEVIMVCLRPTSSL